VIHLSNNENNAIIYMLKKPEGVEKLKSLINTFK